MVLLWLILLPYNQIRGITLFFFFKFKVKKENWLFPFLNFKLIKKFLTCCIIFFFKFCIKNPISNILMAVVLNSGTEITCIKQLILTERSESLNSYKTFHPSRPYFLRSWMTLLNRQRPNRSFCQSGPASLYSNFFSVMVPVPPLPNDRNMLAFRPCGGSTVIWREKKLPGVIQNLIKTLIYNSWRNSK